VFGLGGKVLSNTPHWKYPDLKSSHLLYSFSQGRNLSDDESVCKPSDAIRYIARSRRVPIESLKIPQHLILTYQRNTFDCAKRLTKGDCIEWLYGESQPFCVGHFNRLEVGVGRFWIGAPATAFTLEEAIACGARTVFEVGVSGGIQSHLQPSDIVIITKAIRDEGTSHHYLPPRVEVESDTVLRDKLIQHLNKKRVRHFVGPVWSTDGPYRETRGKLRKFRDSGVMAVDMETSAVFAVAKYRKVRAASAQVISDVLTENGWELAFGHQSVAQRTETLLRNVLEVISEK
jgi:uridine phosphorylase